MSIRREHKVVWAVSCRVCGAERGQPCIPRTAAERAIGKRLWVHTERRRAWQDWRNAHRPDFHAQSVGPVGGRIAPQSRRARVALLELVAGAEDRGEYVWVPNLREASDTLTMDGWIVQ